MPGFAASLRLLKATNDVMSIHLYLEGTKTFAAGRGGMLVHSALLVQRGALTEFKSTKARVRVAAGADSAGQVSLRIEGNAIASGLAAPFVAPCTLIGAGIDRSVVVSVDGASVLSEPRIFEAGAAAGSALLDPVITKSLASQAVNTIFVPGGDSAARPLLPQDR